MDSKLEKRTYMQTVWFISRYWDMKIQYEDILESSPSGNGGIKSSNISNPVAMKQEKLERLHDDIKIIEDAISIVPEHLREGILMNIIIKKKYPNNANLKTYKKWKRRFIFQVAYKKGFIYE